MQHARAARFNAMFQIRTTENLADASSARLISACKHDPTTSELRSLIDCKPMALT